MARAAIAALSFASLTLAALLLAGCGGDDDTTQPEPESSPYAEPSSPENVLRNLVTAYQREDLAAYANVLADDFLFRPSPDYTSVEDYLTRSEDLASTARMFDLAEGISLALPADSSRLSTDIDYPALAGYRMIDVPATLEVRVPGALGETFVYAFQNHPLRFIFGPDDPDAPASWTIVSQQDLFTGSPPPAPIAAPDASSIAAEDVTWSEIKYLHLPPIDAYVEPTGPENVLRNLITSYRRRDMRAYHRLLAPEYRHTSETAPTTLDELDRWEDERVVSEMFASAHRVFIALDHGDPTPSAHPDYPAVSGYQQILATARLSVHTRDGGGGLSIIEVARESVRFIFRPDDAIPPGWTLARQEDIDLGVLARPPIEVTNWMGLKAAFWSPPPEYIPPTSPENVLDNLILAYDRQHHAGYAALLDTAFVFIPSPFDDPGFERLDYADDLEATGCLFGAVTDLEIVIDFDPAVPSDVEGYPAAEGYRMIETSFAWISALHAPAGQDPIVLLVNGDPARFVFKPDDPIEPSAWTLVRQEDLHTGPSPRTENRSWGELKALCE